MPQPEKPERGFHPLHSFLRDRAAWRKVSPPPALPRPRIVVTQAGGVALAKLVGYFRPLWPDEIDAALAEGETGRIEGVHPGKLFHWKLKADIGLEAARIEYPPAPSDVTGAKRRGAAR